MSLNNYLVRYTFKGIDGLPETKVVKYENQSTSLTKMKVNCKRIANKQGWRLLDVQKLA